MIRRSSDRERLEKEMFGGPGLAHFTKILGDGEFAGKGRLFNQLILHPGEAVGYHVHKGDFEVYLILRGTAEYDDNGTKMQLAAGDVTVCHAGEGHALLNNGTEDLEAIALILYE